MAALRWRCLFLLGAVSLPGLVEAQEGAPAPRRGDVDEDGAVTITDAINVLGFLFLSSPAPYCDPVADASGDGLVNITDPVRILNFLFLGDVDLPPLSEDELVACGWNSQPPSFPPLPPYRAYPGYPVEIALGAVDPEGETLRYEANDLPAGASLDPETGVLRWTPVEEDVGRVTVTCAVTDGGRPPNRVEADLTFEVLPPDPCLLPRCDPALGCDPVPVEDLATECCGDPGPRMPDPEVDCPEGAVLHAGRNRAIAPTIGRLQNCDGLRVAALAQGGSGVHLNLEARCVDASWLVSIRARLETATNVLADDVTERFLNERADGYYEARSLGLSASSQFSEGEEAYLTLTLRDASNKELVRRVRVALTKGTLGDLP